MIADLKVFTELLEPRRLLSTTYYNLTPDDYYGPPEDAPPPSLGVWSGTSSDNGMTFLCSTGGVANANSVTVSGLPAHAMLAIGVGNDYGDTDRSNGKTDTLTIQAGNRTETVTYDENGDDIHSANYGRWFAQSSDSITITLSAAVGAGEDLAIQGVELAVYTPTVSLSGGGATDEDNSNPVNFTVNRDLPQGYQGIAEGDEAIPSTDVELDTPTGTATNGVDYQTLPPSVEIPVTHEASTAQSATIPLTPIDDSQAEGVETIFLSLEPTQASDPYILADLPATAPATNAATQEATIDDNVSVSSIEVYVDPAAKAVNKVGYFEFQDDVVIIGEHLDEVLITQLIQATTTVTDETGASLTPQQILALYPSTQDPNTLNSNGEFVTDTSWGWQSLQVVPGTDNGEAIMEDIQTFPVPGRGTLPIDLSVQNSVRTRIADLATSINNFQIQTESAVSDITLKTVDWGYTWSNTNLSWAQAPFPCAAQFLGKPQFTAIQLITGLSDLNL